MLPRFPSVCVYCASSNHCRAVFRDFSAEIGRALATSGRTIVYGGGRNGLMGLLADGALEAGGNVVGIIPSFMKEREWAHDGVAELQVVNTMHERKEAMMMRSDAILALPGGTGTLEELLEAITWKRLGLIRSPILVANVDGYYDPLEEMLRRTVDERFMNPEHLEMWTFVRSAGEVLSALETARPWHDDAISRAVVHGHPTASDM